VVKPTDHIDISEVTEGYAAHMVRFVKEHRLEGIVAKRSDSVYQPGKRTGLWAKHRFDLEKPFVIGGFIPSDLGVDSLIVGYYRGKDLYYAGRVRAGFIPATRREVFSRIKHLVQSKCPFTNLPERDRSRWGEGLTAEKMKEGIWLRPEAVAQVKFLEWTGSDHLRHTTFVGLRDDIEARNVSEPTSSSV
jgi:ATP-dependent DNA ligase